MKTKRKNFKLITFGAVLITIAIVVFYSCHKEKIEVYSDSSPIVIRSLSSQEQNMVDVWEKDILNERKLKNSDSKINIEFNFDKLSSAKMKGSDINSIVVRQKDYNERSTINYCMAIYYDKGKIFSTMIIKIENLSEIIKNVTYFDMDYNVLSKIEINSQTKSINIVNRKDNLLSGLKQQDVGQCTANCIGAAYTQNGWASVGAWVISAFFPEAVATIAAACAGKCIDNR